MMASISTECLVEVDFQRCDELGRILCKHPIPEDREDSPLLGFSSDEVANFYFALVAICHQTSPLGRLPLEGSVDGKWLRGWDYLAGRFEAAARADRTWLDPSRWIVLNEHDLSAIYRDDQAGDRLSDVTGRVALLRNLGVTLRQQSWRNATDLYTACGGRVAVGTPNLLSSLTKFSAYSDPVKKKSVFLLALMKSSGVWKYLDDENLGPPVDYHEVRGHLRIGTVKIVDDQLLWRMQAGKAVTPTDDVAIRKAVYDAIMYISNSTGIKNPSKLHYLFWNVFRSICTRSSPQCFEIREKNPLPGRYHYLMYETVTRSCPFSQICSSAGTTDPILEHQIDTNYY